MVVVGGGTPPEGAMDNYNLVIRKNPIGRRASLNGLLGDGYLGCDDITRWKGDSYN